MRHATNVEGGVAACFRRQSLRLFCCRRGKGNLFDGAGIAVIACRPAVRFMKNCSLRWVVLVVMFSLAQAAEKAEDDFRIKGLRETRSTDLILVGDSWVRDPKRIMATVRVKEDAAASGITLVAYFYDKDNQVIGSSKPNPIWAQTARGWESVGVPGTLQKGKDIDVYFSVTQALESKKWKTVLVVFGSSTSVVARSLPTAAYPKLVFPEQDHVVKEKPGP